MRASSAPSGSTPQKPRGFCNARPIEKGLHPFRLRFKRDLIHPMKPGSRGTASFPPRDSTRPPSSGSNVRPVSLSGIPLDSLDAEETVARIQEMIASRLPHCVLTADARLLALAGGDMELRRILLAGDLLLGQGALIRWAAWLLGSPLPKGAARTDLLARLVQVAATRGQQIFLLGMETGSANLLAARLRLQAPALKLVCHVLPPCRHLWEMDHLSLAQRIRAVRPDLLLVAFDSPLAEKWCAMHARALGVPVTLGLGARGGKLLGRGRLPFVSAVLRQAWTLRRRTVPTGPLEEPASFATTGRLRVWAGSRLDRVELHRDEEFWNEARAARHHCLLDLSQVRSIDSAGVAFLVHWQKDLAHSSRRLVLLMPSGEVQRALHAMRLGDHFLTTDNLDEPLPFLLAGGLFPAPVQSTRLDPPALRWQNEITAANVDEAWQLTLQHFEARPAHQSAFFIDLSDLHFLDSSGIGLMLRLKKWAAACGVQLSFIHARPAVRAMLRLAELEQTLLTHA